jgi:signal transduction histidine kinase
MTITPLVQPDGTITNFIALKQDITERKQTEEQLKLAHKQAVEANRLKTQLLASVSHDLRTPLGTIMGYAEMLLVEAFGPQNEAQKTATAEILNSANSLLTFVNNLIGQAQIETGKIMLNNQPFEPSVLVDSIRSVVNYHAAKKNLNLKIEIDPQLPQVLIGDSYWLRQILLNLVNNAIKFTQTGSVHIRFYKSNDTTWALQVSDTGIGIPEKDRENIFDAFYQHSDVSEKKYGGSGLGLSIVKQLTILMGGKIELESQVGQGSTCTVLLPLVVAPEEAG